MNQGDGEGREVLTAGVIDGAEGVGREEGTREEGGTEGLREMGNDR